MSDDATPAKVRLTDGLGPLPEPRTLSRGDEDGPLQLGYTANQMRAYAAQAVAAERERRNDLAKEFDQMLNEMTLLRKNLFQMQEAAKALALELEDQRSVMACLEGIGEWIRRRKNK